MRKLTSKSPSADVATRLSSNPGHGPGEAQNPATTDNARAEPTRDELFEQCKELATATCILNCFEKELRRSGVVGSVDNFKIVLLATITRFFKQPVSVVLKGDATAGKSFTVDTTLRYVPDEGYESMSGMSPKALMYWKCDLRHKMLCIGEFAGLQSETGNPWLRQLLTEGNIRYVVTGEDNGEGRTSREMVIEGPVGLIMTTTTQKLHPEDESRMISLFLDDSPEHTSAVLRSQAMKDAGLEAAPSNTVPWQALHRWVAAGSKAVVIPFGLDLAAKADPTNGRMKRDFPKVLALVKAHALLHQATREQDANGRIMATLADYEAVHDLLAVPLSEGQAETLDPHVNDIIAAVSVLSLGATQEDGVPQHAIVDFFDGDDPQRRIAKSTVSRRVKKALEQGYLKAGHYKPGVGHQLKIDKPRIKVRAALPDPASLLQETCGKE
jgi:hypothetical protein